ncbi:hypothetical protein [Caudoviricetes sp.]|nr:hypothetical protein [Caudoviricetes sp.]
MSPVPRLHLTDETTRASGVFLLPAVTRPVPRASGMPAAWFVVAFAALVAIEMWALSRFGFFQ